MRSIVLVTACAILAGAWSPAFSQTADMARFHRASVRALNRENATEVITKAMKGKKPEEARASGQQLAARGVVRLKADDLKRRAELMLEFTSRAGSKVCAAWSRGTLTSEQTTSMIAKLDSAAFDDWVVLSVRSMTAEVRGKPKAFNGAQKDVTRMFEVLATVMTPDENQRFHAVMTGFDGASNQDACWFGQQLYRSALALEKKQREHTLRTLAWIELKPS
ncbi:MAG TPA: hypothetical protein VJ808_03695 [Gemmatimonadales bacterium]|nr:hypothetical protein [Gemmatimonadales bacterium]